MERLLFEIRRESIHQRSTVATDAHVPGPAGRCPIPKKVPTSQAQRVREVGDSVLAALVLIVVRSGLRALLYFLEQLGIKHR